jgi:hypothetical protein
MKKIILATTFVLASMGANAANLATNFGDDLASVTSNGAELILAGGYTSKTVNQSKLEVSEGSVSIQSNIGKYGSVNAGAGASTLDLTIGRRSVSTSATAYNFGYSNGIKVNDVLLAGHIGYTRLATDYVGVNVTSATVEGIYTGLKTFKPFVGASHTIASINGYTGDGNQYALGTYVDFNSTISAKVALTRTYAYGVTLSGAQAAINIKL